MSETVVILGVSDVEDVIEDYDFTDTVNNIVDDHDFDWLKDEINDNLDINYEIEQYVSTMSLPDCAAAAIEGSVEDALNNKDFVQGGVFTNNEIKVLKVVVELLNKYMERGETDGLKR